VASLSHCTLSPILVGKFQRRSPRYSESPSGNPERPRPRCVESSSRTFASSNGDSSRTDCVAAVGVAAAHTAVWQPALFREKKFRIVRSNSIGMRLLASVDGCTTECQAFIVTGTAVLSVLTASCRQTWCLAASSRSSRDQMRYAYRHLSAPSSTSADSRSSR